MYRLGMRLIPFPTAYSPRRAAVVCTTLAALLVAPSATRLAAQRAGPDGPTSQVTLDRLFTTPDFQEDFFGPARWLPGSTTGAYTTLEPAAGGPDGATDIVRYDGVTGVHAVIVPASKLVPPGATAPLEIENYVFSPDRNHVIIFTNSRQVWRQRTRGDFWLLDLGSWTLRKLGGPNAPPSTLMFAKFSPDGRRVAYVREHNLYVEDVATPKITQLTSDGSTTLINGTFDWVYEEELNLRDGFRWSPDGQRIAYWQLDASGVRDYDLIDDTDSLYSFVKPVQYPKAGETNSGGRVGTVSANGGPTQWLAVPGDPRNNYIARMDWAASSDEVVLQHLNRHQDTLVVMLGDARTGAVHSVLTEHDSAWVDVDDEVHWLHGGKDFLWVSERDGWRHAYLVSRDGASTRLLTPGNFDLTEPDSPFGAEFIQAIDSVRGFVYYLASPDNATQVYLYRSRLDGTGRPERVTPAGQRGAHHYDISPDHRWALHTYSTLDTPPTTDLVRLPDHTVVRTLMDNARLKATMAGVARHPVEFTRLDGAAGGVPGVQYDAWVIKPPAFDSTKHYPVLFFVYGGPAQATVVDQWDGFNYPFHLLLAQKGYVIVSVDNRGTPAPRGRAWRKAIYQRIGVVDTQDQTAAARAFVQRSYADATRVAVWGWSNGGTMTLNLLFHSPSVYQVGMAVAPVSDQRFYDTIYSERYMGLPQENPGAYRLASPATFVDSLRGKLLLVHGSGDDNVHFQNSETVINALVAADKQFTMMDYPNRTHCICEGPGTTRHLFGLLSGFLGTNLPPGGR
jgi:dipeptidyl-peptidase-4